MATHLERNVLTLWTIIGENEYSYGFSFKLNYVDNTSFYAVRYNTDKYGGPYRFISSCPIRNYYKRNDSLQANTPQKWFTYIYRSGELPTIEPIKNSPPTNNSNGKSISINPDGKPISVNSNGKPIIITNPDTANKKP